MPTPTAILAQLTAIANAGTEVAFAIHVAVVTSLLMMLTGWRPAKRTVAIVAVAPFALVGLFAWVFGNAFNGLVFAALFASLGAIALGAPREPAHLGAPWASALGAILVGYALLYPHFLEPRPAIAYLVAAPVGVVPCPTLALAIGISLLADAPAGRAGSLVLSAAGLFYGLFGALRLGVWLDLGLLAGALALPFAALTRVTAPGTRLST